MSLSMFGVMRKVVQAAFPEPCRKFGVMAVFASAICVAGVARGEAPVVSASEFEASSGSYSERQSSSFRQRMATVIPTAYSYEEGESSDAAEATAESSDCASCEASCDGGCDSMGGDDEPWKLFPNSIMGFNIGGWTSVGYHTFDNNGNFNRHSDNVNLHQAWLYAEKIADGSKGVGFGGRIDYLYGVDAQDTQGFGQSDGHWDTDWDNGIYGHAIPQAYGEVAMGDMSVKIGKFFTIIGYEVVGAPGNFFYSHSYTMYNSEPFTHTGVLSSYKASDDITVFNGWVQGWDTGFRDNGDAYLGGASMKLTENTNFISSVVAGNFGKDAADESGFMVSNILTTKLSDKLNYVLWVDILDTDRTGRAVQRKTFDLNQYFLYTVSDNIVWGNRIEWYHVDRGVFGATETNDIYAYTTGFNYRVGKNTLLRPELRWDWDKGGLVGNERGNVQTTFGSDMIFTF